MNKFIYEFVQESRYSKKAGQTSYNKNGTM